MWRAKTLLRRPRPAATFQPTTSQHDGSLILTPYRQARRGRGASTCEQRELGAPSREGRELPRIERIIERHQGYLAVKNGLSASSATVKL